MLFCLVKHSQMKIKIEVSQHSSDPHDFYGISDFMPSAQLLLASLVCRKSGGKRLRSYFRPAISADQWYLTIFSK